MTITNASTHDLLPVGNSPAVSSLPPGPSLLETGTTLTDPGRPGPVAHSTGAAQDRGGNDAIVEDVQIGPCRMILGDMRAVLPVIAPAADLILSDPPYRLTAGGNTTGEMKGIFARDRYDNSGDLFAMVEWADMGPLMCAAAAPDADCIIMTVDRQEAEARRAFEAAGFGFHRLLVWDKVTATPNRWFMPNCEFALYLYKGRARTISYPATKQLIRCPQKDVTQHPTEKPVALFQSWIVNCCPPGGLVLDPFMGSGSAMVAALRAGRCGIGIEVERRWFDVACQRVEDALRHFQSDWIADDIGGAV